MDEPVLLELKSLHLTIVSGRSSVPILRGVTLTVRKGEIVGLVGESGSGKSMTARSIVQSLPKGAQITGEVVLNGRNVSQLSKRELRETRSKTVGVIFQDPRSGVDPMWTIEDHLTEGMRVHAKLSRTQARARAIDLLSQVGIPDGNRRLRQHPHELSGGLLQRVVIAGALASDPELIVADEPTTALDVTSQAEVVAIFARLRRDRGLGMLFVTHDLALAASLCDRIVVMYAGQVVEDRAGHEILDRPTHPYTAALVAARPILEERVQRLSVIPGQPISAAAAPSGCAFRDRCSFAVEQCAHASMKLETVNGGLSACCRGDVVGGGRVE